MSRKKIDNVWNQHYGAHLGTLNNPAQDQQLLTERMYIRLLTEFSANRFKWEGLPDSVDVRYLELLLFNRALAVFYREEDIDDYLALPAAGSGEINMYGNPKTFTVTAPGISRTLNALDLKTEKAECVPIWANYMRIPDLDIVLLYAKKLAALDRTIEINTENMRYTKVIVADENQRLSWVNIIRQHTEGQPVIFGTRGLDMSQVSAFDVAPHPDSVPKLITARHQLWNQCMTLLGINNSNQEKKERMVTDEVSANDDQVLTARAVALNARRQACEQLKKVFGLDVTVDYVNSMEDPDPEEGEGNEGQEAA